jgi:hypothetical protein
MRNIVEKPIIYPKFLNLTLNKLLTPSNPFDIINIFCFQVLLKNTVRKLFSIYGNAFHHYANQVILQNTRDIGFILYVKMKKMNFRYIVKYQFLS